MNQKAAILIVSVSAVAIAFLVWLIYFHARPTVIPEWANLLPWCNAAWNSMSACSLVYGYTLIKAGRREAHRNAMVGAFVFSTLFLVTYVTYHHFHGDSKFPGQGLVRPIYFAVLISHVSLSALVLPMALGALFLGLSNQLGLHRRLAKVTFPLWLYVSVTGVVIVFFLKAYA